jgi:hypothetical protein
MACATGRQTGVLEKSPSLGSSGIHVLSCCGFPSFHRGYYWYFPVIFKTKKESLETTRRGGGQERRCISQLLQATDLQTGRLVFPV